MATQEELYRQRQDELVALLRTPMTLNEMQTKLRVSYHTIWRSLKQLQQMGMVHETSWRQGREKVYVANNAAKDGVVYITTPAGSRPLGDWVNQTTFDVILDPIRDISGALAQCYRNSAFKDSAMQEHLAGSMTPQESKAELRKSLEIVRRLVLAAEQMLLADIWTDATPANAEKFGTVDVPLAVQTGEAFERRHGHA